VPVQTEVVPTGAAAAPDVMASAWSEPSLPCRAAAAGKIGAIKASWAPGVPTTINVTGLAVAHPSASPWELVASDGHGPATVASSYGPTCAIQLPVTATVSPAWRVAVTAPDGRGRKLLGVL
jgi:hypothetical protein